MSDSTDIQHFVSWFRGSAPYIQAFRGRTFVIVFGGEILSENQLDRLAQDLTLLHSLGIRLVLVHGARPQIEARLAARDIRMHYAKGMRITDEAALECVMEASGSLRVAIEARLSMGLSRSPAGSVPVHIVSGNFVTAQPIGVRDGVDFQHTGRVRRIDGESIKSRLDDQAMVLLSPLGYSPTGEVFNLSALDVAAAAARALQADKLICLSEDALLADLPRQLTLDEAQRLLSDLPQDNEDGGLYSTLNHALQVCRHGVRRSHLLARGQDGALLLEMFTRDGVGTMINADVYEGTREARLEDIGGILELIHPMEEAGSLVRRSREQLEIDISDYSVIERDGAVIACAALHRFSDSSSAELACVAVADDYRHHGYGHSILSHIEHQARQTGLSHLFVLTTEAAHWFQERGFEAADISRLPVEKQALINYQRNSKVFLKAL